MNDPKEEKPTPTKEELQKTVKKARPGHLWIKGQSGNPAGRPKDIKVYRYRAIIEEFEKEKKTTLLELACQRAWDGDNYLLAKILNKILPDKLEVEQDTEITVNIIRNYQELRDSKDSRKNENISTQKIEGENNNGGNDEE